MQRDAFFTPYAIFQKHALTEQLTLHALTQHTKTILQHTGSFATPLQHLLRNSCRYLLLPVATTHATPSDLWQP